MTDHPVTVHQPYTPGRGLPIASPLGSVSDGASPQATGLDRDSRGTNTPPLPPSELSRPGGPVKVGTIALKRIGQVMPDRDRVVLERIDEHRYLTTHQLQRFVFTTHMSEVSAARTARRVLGRLQRLNLVRALDRRVGGVRAGSVANVWQLAPAGARLLRDDGGRYRTHEPSPRFLDHCLAVGDVHLAIRDLAAEGPDVTATVEIEPRSWRRYMGQGGEPRWLQPDLAAVLQTPTFEDRWFIEVDLGTESLPTLLRKCSQYEAYRASGTEQNAHGAFPLILWLFTKGERAERLSRSIARTTRLTPHLYRFATPASFRSVIAEPST